MADNYTTKDSGQRDEFPTGARRDTQDGKGRFDLIPPQLLQQLAQELERVGEDRDTLLGLTLLPMRPLMRLAALYGRGAQKYGPSNWRCGIPLSRTLSSLLRHIVAWTAGMDDEDHLAAVIWNAFTLLATQSLIQEGVLPASLGDAGPIAKTTCVQWIAAILAGDPQARVLPAPMTNTEPT